jgi:hypothetical protein
MITVLRCAAAVLAATFLSTTIALADPYADMAAFGQAFAAAKSYHMSVTGASGNTIEMDVVNPGKYHMTMNGGIEAIVIQPDMWVNMHGSWMHMSGAMGDRMQGMIGNVKGAIPTGNYKTDYTVTDLGMKDGYHAYDVTHKANSDHSIIYLMPGSLPAKIEAFSDGKKTTIAFSNFNSPSITVAPPAQ